MQCPRCQAHISIGASFCVECRSPVRNVGISASAVTAALPIRASSRPERRLLTVLFCDLVGSTALGGRLDLEDLRDVLSAYQRRATEIVEAAGGRIARYEGDGVLAYFGYPVANEDDAERAVNAGLELAQSINQGSNVPEKLNVRVGIATGVVVVGDLMLSSVADNPPIVGDTPNLAARLQGLAEPNAVVVAASTQRLVGNLFEYRNLDLHNLNGFAQPVQAWEVIGPSGIASRFEALRSKLPLVGRDIEMEFLMQQWQQAKSGTGRIVIFVGAAGIGKSRLKLELLARLSRELPVVRRYYCSPHHKDSMLFPLLAQLQKAAMFDRADSPEDKLEKLAAIAADGTVSSEVLGLLADLMALPATNRVRSIRLDPRRKRKVLFEALVRRLEQIAQQRPTIISVEDIHWIDPTSRELLETIVHRVARIPVLMILTSRPGDMPGWVSQPHVSVLELSPVNNRSAELLAKQIPGAVGLADAVLKNIVTRAQGVPLFIEELTKATVENSSVEALRNAPLLQSIPSVPVTLQATLMARLDRLGSARNIAKTAATLGKEFQFDLLHAVTLEHNAEELQGLLRQLINAQLIVPISSFPSETYAFRHALIQDAAYATLLRQERKELHTRVAKALQNQFPESVAMQPELLAWHLTRAELFELAIGAWLEAGNRAAARAAFLEAVDHFKEGIRLIQFLPESQSRSGRELELQLALGPAMMATRGYAAAEGLGVYSRAQELVSEVGNRREQMEVLLGLFNVHFGRAELEQAMAAARQNFVLAEAEGILEGRAYTLMGQTHAAVGSFAEARSAFERALGIFAKTPEAPESFGVFGSQHVISSAFLSGVYFALGEPDQAQNATAQSIDRARALRHPMSMAVALVTELLTPIPGGMRADAMQAEEVIRFCNENALSNFEVWARFAQGAIKARRGDPREGIRIMRSAIDAAEGMSSRLLRPVQYATVASAHAKLGQIDEALLLVEQAILIAKTTGERRADAALHRLLGELLLASNKYEDGRQALMRALETARTQHANSEESRITTVLETLARH
jgi:class 3 adenylate cyclase/tetratricopeptide (TPR) repeat protein